MFKKGNNVVVAIAFVVEVVVASCSPDQHPVMSS